MGNSKRPVICQKVLQVSRELGDGVFQCVVGEVGPTDRKLEHYCLLPKQSWRTGRGCEPESLLLVRPSPALPPWGQHCSVFLETTGIGSLVPQPTIWYPDTDESLTDPNTESSEMGLSWSPLLDEEAVALGFIASQGFRIQKSQS